MLFIKAVATKLIDDTSYPEIVLCHFFDINNTKHEFIEKWPVVSDASFSGIFPVDCLIGCSVIEDRGTSLLVNTHSPWGIESTKGETTFEVSAEILVGRQ